MNANEGAELGGKTAEEPAPSQFVSEVSWKDRYQVQKELVLQIRSHQFEYGKWLLASLLAVHAGSLLAISQAGDARERLYYACGPLLIFGIAVTLVAGGVAWINFTLATYAYHDGLRALRFEQEPAFKKWQKITVDGTMYLTMIAAATSLALFVWAAVTATSALKAPEKEYHYKS